MSIVSIRDLGIRYTIYRSLGKSLRRGILHWASGELKRQEFWALRHVSLDIHEGEVLGVVGRNGAGKSTLCMAIAQVLAPDEGEVTVRGRTAPILSLGAGFNRDMTGLENIRLGGALMGLSPEEVGAMEPSIVTFADLGDFINNPVRTYSSGMRARLAFSVATCVEPDVLILDEVLGVGDAAFMEKSRARMLQLMEHARSIILVSHTLATIRELCTAALWLEGGQIKAYGPIETVLEDYQGWMKGR